MESQTVGGGKNGMAVFKLLDFGLIDDGQWLYIKKQYRLTKREVEVAKLICQGFGNEEIANNLNIAYGTVRAHIRNIYRKTGVQNKIAILLKFISEISKAEPKAKPSPPTKKNFVVSYTY